jgi:SSS family solute:Na+ symporter
MGAGSLYLAIREPASLVSLLLVGYAGVVQFFPGVLLGLYWPRARGSAVFIGMIVGIGLSSFLMLTHRDPFHGWNAGFLGLCANFLLTVGLSAGVSRSADRAAAAAATPGA